MVASAVKERDAEFCLSWCTARYMNPMIVVGCGQENVAKVMSLSQTLHND